MIITISLTVGCSSAKVSPTAQTISPDIINSVMPSFAPSTPTHISSPNAMSTKISETRAPDSCFAVAEEKVPLESIAIGTVLIGKGYNYGQSLLDLSTGIKYEVTTQSQCAFCVRWAVSPDKSLLAGTEEIQNNSGQFEKTILWVLNARAEVFKKIPLDLSGLYNMHWLDNQNIIFHTEQTTKDGTVMLVNPFNGEQNYISNKLPNFYTENYLYPTLGWLIEYSPNLEWGIYFGLTPSGELGYVIRNFTNEKTVLQVADTSGEYQKPVWSADRDEIAVVISGRPYLINRRGEARSILNESQQSQVARLSWSLSGRYIAFWNFDTLMIYDAQSEKVSDTCFKSKEQFSLIWSPDDRQISIPKYLGDGSILIDIQENKIYNLTVMPDIIYPQEWMNSIP